MTRSILLPIIMIAAAFGVVMMYTMPAYEKVQELKKQEAEVSKTLDNANKIVRLVDDLKVQYDSFPVETREKLQKMLPETNDPIDIIVEVNNIADNQVILTEAKAANEVPNPNAVFVTHKPYKTINASYEVSTNYQNLLSFIESIELGLRLTDIKKLDFSIDDNTGFIDVSIDTNTYWVNE